MAKEASADREINGAREIAAQILEFCFPLLLADAIRRSHPMASHLFSLLADEGETLAPGLAEDDNRVVLSSAWIDLTSGPVVLCLPNTHGRYLSVTLIDSAGEPFASIGTRTRDDTGVDLALAGPSWHGEIPDGLTARRAPSEGVWAVSRLHAHSAADRPEAEALASRQRLAFLERVHGHDATTARPLELLSSSLQQVADTGAAVLRHRLDTLLRRAPTIYQRTVRPQVASLWAQFDAPEQGADWTTALERALEGGVADGLAAIRRAAAAASRDEAPGWRDHGYDLEDRPTSALDRAVRAFTSIGAAVRDDTMWLTCDRDEAGRTLSGAETYRLHFAADALPPVEAFWWLSAMPASPTERRGGLGDRSDLAPNPDGSLDILVQREPPDPAASSNILAAPPGEFALQMRLYWPRTAALGGAWRMPPVERLGSTSTKASGAAAPLRNPSPTIIQAHLKAESRPSFPQRKSPS